jgi:hypothetical protein
MVPIVEDVLTGAVSRNVQQAAGKLAAIHTGALREQSR